jgi:acyl-CoA thioester hydrolase
MHWPAHSSFIIHHYYKMFTFTFPDLRVRYADTDQMGYVYYGNYARYYEIGRVEALRSLGISYRDLEAAGVLMPVYDLRCRYHRPARYDDLLTLHLTIPTLPKARIVFQYELLNDAGERLNTGETTLVFQRADTGRLVAAPDHLITALKPFFAEEVDKE